MINIDLTMWRFGNPLDPYALGRMTIANDGTSKTPKRGNYIVKAYSRNGRLLRTAEVKDWARLSRPVFELLKAALSALDYK